MTRDEMVITATYLRREPLWKLLKAFLKMRLMSEKTFTEITR